MQSRFTPAQQAQLRAYNEALHPMGQVFMDLPQNRQQSYIVGFISRMGTSQRTVAATATPLSPPVNNSLESWLPANLAYAFLDFQPFRAQLGDQPPEYFAHARHAAPNAVCELAQFLRWYFLRAATMTP